jgi:putative PIN family toxin of toxin-antitoxin system
LRGAVDTNIWVSALLNPHGAPARVLAYLKQQHFTLVTSEPLLLELAEVLGRQRIIRKYSLIPEQVADLLTTLRQGAQLVTVQDAPQVCRDPKDDIVIATALQGKADVLVSRDEDLTRASDVVEHLAAAGIRVLTVRQFLQELETPDDE